MDASPSKFIAAVIDGSAEAARAVLFAARRARASGARLLLLAPIAPPDGVHWPLVDEEMRALAREEARRAAAPLIDLAEQELDAPVWFDVREGQAKDAVRAALADYAGVFELVLASGPTGNAGPLLAAAGRGERLSQRPIPIVLLPHGVSESDIRNLSV